MKRFLSMLFIIAVFVTVSGCTQNEEQQIIENKQLNESKQLNENQQVNKQNCLQDDCLLVADVEYPVGELSDEIIEALELALEDEYKARTTYEVNFLVSKLVMGFFCKRIYCTPTNISKNISL